MASRLHYDSRIMKHDEPKSSPKFNEFPNFDRLPIKIRLKIWRSTIQPRNIAIGQDTVGRWQFRYDLNRVPYPDALHVCREARSELLRQYTLLNLPSTCYYQPLSKPPSYVNFAIDTLIFPNLYLTGGDLEVYFAAMGEQSQMIQSIVVGRDIFGNIDESTIKLLSGLPHLNNLRVHLGGGVAKELLVFDPTLEHELGIDYAPDSYCWSLLSEAFRRRIAKHWPSSPLPFKGFSCTDNGIEPRYINERSVFIGEFRDWMKAE